MWKGMRLLQEEHMGTYRVHQLPRGNHVYADHLCATLGSKSEGRFKTRLGETSPICGMNLYSCIAPTFLLGRGNTALIATVKWGRGALKSSKIPWFSMQIMLPSGIWFWLLTWHYTHNKDPKIACMRKNLWLHIFLQDHENFRAHLMHEIYHPLVSDPSGIKWDRKMGRILDPSMKFFSSCQQKALPTTYIFLNYDAFFVKKQSNKKSILQLWNLFIF